EDAAGKHCGEGRNARVRMNSGEQPLSRRTNFAVIQENERLNQLADVGRADEAGDRAMPAAAGAKSDTALAGAYRCLLQSGNVVHLCIPLRGLCRDICSGPGGEVSRLAARDLVREGNAIARIRTQVCMGLEIGEGLRHFGRPGEQVGEGLLWDLLE